MDELFGNNNEDGSGVSESVGNVAHIYTMEEITIGLAAIGALVASIVYSFRHIKSSSCMGMKCQQEVVDVVHVESGTVSGRQETDV